MYKAITLFGLISLFIIVVFPGSASSGEFTIMQGWLVGKDCLKAKKIVCPLEEYIKEALILLTADKQTYKFEKNGVEEWKVQKAYGQLIVVKGIKDGDIMKVTNIVQVTGDKKLTKA